MAEKELVKNLIPNLKMESAKPLRIEIFLFIDCPK